MKRAHAKTLIMSTNSSRLSVKRQRLCRRDNLEYEPDSVRISAPGPGLQKHDRKFVKAFDEAIDAYSETRYNGMSQTQIELDEVIVDLPGSSKQLGEHAESIDVIEEPRDESEDPCEVSGKDNKQSFTRNDSGYSSGELDDVDEDDVIPNDTTVLYKEKVPMAVLKHKQFIRATSPCSSGLDRTIWKKQHQRNGHGVLTILRNLHLRSTEEPDQEAIVYISSPQSTDPLGDRFGVTIWTFNPSEDFPYYRHFTRFIEPNSPAQKMRIREWDELVMLNDYFVPEDNHTDVLNRFHHLNVDGITRQTFVLRRQVDNQDHKRRHWLWVETSARLAPGEITIDRTESVDVRAPQFQESSRSVYSKKTEVKYQIRGETEYMAIVPDLGVIATVNRSGDDTTTIVKHDEIWFEKNNLRRATTLSRCVNGQNQYVNVDEDGNVNTSTNLQWLEPKQIGADVRFGYKDRMIACNRQTHAFLGLKERVLQRNAAVYSYWFTEYIAQSFHRSVTGLDEPDSANLCPLDVTTKQVPPLGSRFDVNVEEIDKISLSSTDSAGSSSSQSSSSSSSSSSS